MYVLAGVFDTKFVNTQCMVCMYGMYLCNLCMYVCMHVLARGFDTKLVYTQCMYVLYVYVSVSGTSTVRQCSLAWCWR